ncbi:MAG: threonine/serine dehydratase [Pseudomonadota bacterium]
MTPQMIAAAAQRLSGHIVQTPILNSPALDRLAGRRVFVKAECLQHTGSFKYRGGRAAISALSVENRRRGVLAMSSGNHAQGVARAAQELDTPATIVMPSDAPQVKIDGTRNYGAEVVFYDRATEDRATLSADLAAARGLTIISPYDHPEVIAGQGTVGLEIAEFAKALGITQCEVLVCCGGGGLAAGVALALEHHAPGLTVRPVEPEGFDDVARSLRSGKRERNASTTGSIADAILSPMPGEMTFPILHRLCGPGLTVTDQESLHAIAIALAHLKLVLEPGGAAALAASLSCFDEINGDSVIVVATGGNLDLALLPQLQKHL